MSVYQLPAVNAGLNALSTALLLFGWFAIRRGRVDAHRRSMLSAFAVSAVFLGCYLYYHRHAGHVRFTYDVPVIKYGYYAMLFSHILLAIAVPPLVIWAIYLGLKNRLDTHRRVVAWAWPIWLYVSVTGVLIYLALYHFWPSTDLPAIMP
ncbi:MAG: DUF420 domain-containing protein [Planctomycetes bacterium]|nr:DUF420 domain-containing protein [Planctomycetota bacterium]